MPVKTRSHAVSVWMWLLGPALLALHLNYWMWDETRLVLGLPANLFYHLMLSLVVSVVMFVVVRRAWPAYLDRDQDDATDEGK